MGLHRDCGVTAARPIKGAIPLPFLLQPQYDAIDASRNAWVGNAGMKRMTEFLGLAAPVKTPLIGPAHSP